MEKLRVNVSPHIKSGNSTAGIMLDVIIALVPALLASIWFFGIRALTVTLVCVAACVISEALFELCARRSVTVKDLSAVVTGMILAFNLPVTIPYWQAVVGSIVAIVTAYEKEDMEALSALKPNLCMECGCCSYVCPAFRPLVQQNKLAKAALARWKQKQKEKEGK